jgi:hypothetical protein
MIGHICVFAISTSRQRPTDEFLQRRFVLMVEPTEVYNVGAMSCNSISQASNFGRRSCAIGPVSGSEVTNQIKPDTDGAVVRNLAFRGPPSAS